MDGLYIAFLKGRDRSEAFAYGIDRIYNMHIPDVALSFRKSELMDTAPPMTCLFGFLIRVSAECVCDFG